ncbi:MAG TPA: NIPSNAP family protein [Gammaproteobacteria bacterium]
MHRSPTRRRTFRVTGALAGVAAAFTLGFIAAGDGRAQQGQQNAPPAPCGPAGDLPAELARNVAADSRCFELRMYTADPTRDGVGQFKGGINELHQRFRENEVALFEKHGAEVIGVWQSLDNPRTLVYMLAYRDRAHREQVWEDFGADPEWDALRQKYFVPLERPAVYMLSAADYSPLK